MISVTKKWQVQIMFDNHKENNIKYYIYDNIYTSMLRKVSEIHYDKEPLNITITLIINETKQEGIFHP